MAAVTANELNPIFNIKLSIMKIMKNQLLPGLALLGSLLTAHAGLYYQGSGISTTGGTAEGTVANSGTIYDGTTVGSVFTMDLGSAGLGSQLTSIQVSLNVLGGINGNLYSYLVAPNGTVVVLLDHPGVSGSTPFGSTQPGMNLTLADGYAAITASSDLSSGTYGVPTGSGNSLLNFGSLGSPGVDPNGTWTLFFADTVAGGGNETLNGWSLNITAVPEPTTMALGIFGIFAIGGMAWKRYRNEF
jgi:hypothetical protein